MQAIAVAVIIILGIIGLCNFCFILGWEKGRKEGYYNGLKDGRERRTNLFV